MYLIETIADIAAAAAAMAPAGLRAPAFLLTFGVVFHSPLLAAGAFVSWADRRAMRRLRERVRAGRES
jgi:hypothetical protein